MDALVAWLGGEDAVARGLLVGALVAARVAPLALLAPWLGLRGMPAIVRTGLTIALTVMLTPLALEAVPPDADLGPVRFPLLVAREAIVGSVFAVVSGLALLALDWAGRLTDTWRGASLSEVIAPPTGERTSPLGDFYLLMGVAMFAAMGGHRIALAAFVDGLVAVPPGAPMEIGAGAVALGAARLVGAALAFAMSVAAPAAVAIVVVELGLGLVARSAPQVPVFFAGMPLRAATGLAAALVALAVVVGQLPDAFADAIRWAERLVRDLGA